MNTFAEPLENIFRMNKREGQPIVELKLVGGLHHHYMRKAA